MDKNFKDDKRDFRHLISPVLLYAPAFSQKIVCKDYDSCDEQELEKVPKDVIKLLTCSERK